STLKKWYPNATGFRSHGLVQSSNILRKAADYGLKYDSNLLLYDFEMIRPIKTFYNLVRFPYHWSDASNLLWNRENDLSELGLDFEGLKIYDFHPILIYLNEAKLNTHYNKLKAGSTKNLVDLTKNDIDPFIQSSDKGVGNLFDSFLEYIHGNNHITQTLHQLFLSAE
ncbi:MAG: hypothetical protein K0S32_4527, partial [Bacteroidetes bacterium]|nr:hypothetical protein [Bacteroidota bacterium]